jgi:hypothetical protein
MQHGLQTAQGGGICSGVLLGPGPAEVKRTRIVFLHEAGREMIEGDFGDVRAEARQWRLPLLLRVRRRR